MVRSLSALMARPAITMENSRTPPSKAALASSTMVSAVLVVYFGAAVLVGGLAAEVALLGAAAERALVMPQVLT